MSSPSISAGSSSPVRAWIGPALALAVLVALLVGVLVAVRLTGDESLPPVPDRFVPPAGSRPATAFDVERAADGTLSLASGDDSTRRQVELTLPAGTPIDVLEPMDRASLQVGDWVTVIGVPNQARNFAITLVVVTAGGGTPGPDGLVLTPAGFSGHEAAREAREAVVLAGSVAALTEDGATLDVAGVPVALALFDGGPLRLVRPGVPADIADGDRIAVHGVQEGEPDPSEGVLVLVGGAR